jgi:hypothetical protein
VSTFVDRGVSHGQRGRSPDKVSGKILKLGGKAMIPYLAHLLDITINNATISSDWKKAIVIPIYKGVKLQTSQFNLSGQQANGTHYSIISEGNLG